MAFDRVGMMEAARFDVFLGGVIDGAVPRELAPDGRIDRAFIGHHGNIAEYHVPVDTNIHDIDVIFVDEPDEIVNPLGLKCLVKSALVGVAAGSARRISSD